MPGKVAGRRSRIRLAATADGDLPAIGAAGHHVPRSIRFEEIRSTLVQEVLKREVMEGDRAEEARKKIARCAGRALRAAGSERGDEEPVPTRSETRADSPSIPEAPVVPATAVTDTSDRPAA